MLFTFYIKICVPIVSYKKRKKNVCTPPPQGVNRVLNVPILYASCGIDISKYIEGGSMKLATQVDYIYIHVCNGSRRHFRVINVFKKKIFGVS